MADRLNFSTGGLVDPTTGLRSALQSSSEAIGNISKQYMDNQRYQDQLKMQQQQEAENTRRYQDQLKMQQQQEAENTRRWNAQQQQATTLFDAKMADHATKVAGEKAAQDFVQNTNPRDVALGIVKQQQGDNVANAITNKSLTGIDPSMYFDAQDLKDNIQTPWKDAVKQSLDTDPARKALFDQYASTVSQPDMEAVMRKKALAAGVPVDKLDTVIKSFGQMGVDWTAKDKIAYDNKEKDLKTLMDVADTGSKLFTAQNPSGKKGDINPDITGVINTFRTGRIPYTAGSRGVATAISSAIMKDVSFKTPDGKSYTPTYAQRQQAANMILNSNRSGDGSDINIDVNDALAQARQLIVSGSIDTAGIMKKDEQSGYLMDTIRKRALEPAVGGQQQALRQIGGELLGTAGNGNWGRNLPGSTVPLASANADTTTTPTIPSPTAALTPQSNAINPIFLAGYGKAMNDAWVPGTVDENIPHTIGRTLANFPRLGSAAITANPLVLAGQDLVNNKLQNVINSIPSMTSNNPITDLYRGLIGKPIESNRLPIVSDDNLKPGTIAYNIKHGKPLLSTSP